MSKATKTETFSYNSYTENAESTEERKEVMYLFGNRATPRAKRGEAMAGFGLNRMARAGFPFRKRHDSVA